MAQMDEPTHSIRNRTTTLMTGYRHHITAPPESAPSSTYRVSHTLQFAIIISLFLIVASFGLILRSDGSSILLGQSTLRGSVNYPVIHGTVRFVQTATGESVQLIGSITGLAPGEYAFHVHTYGDSRSGLSKSWNNGDIDSSIVGSHFSVGPTTAHGCWPDTNRHTGDLGNITITQFDVTTTFTLSRDLIDLAPISPASIIGRMLIVHRNYDACSSAQPTGNGGTMMAQGVIGIIDPEKYGFGSMNNTASIAPPWISNDRGLPSTQNDAVVGIAVMQPTSTGSEDIRGEVIFSQIRYKDGLSRLRVVCNMTGLEPWSSHGLHIHTWGDDSIADGSYAGRYWNPTNTSHGLPSQSMEERYAGDLGNVLADGNGRAIVDFVIDGTSLIGMSNVIGRAVILESSPDTGESTPSRGTAGVRSNSIAIGVIGLSSYRPRAGLEDGYYARATIRGSIGISQIRGSILLSQPQGPGLFQPVTITGDIFGLPLAPDGTPMSYAIHIHEFGDVSSGSFLNNEVIDMNVIGGHFNPGGKLHGCPPNIDRHAGDIGNILVTKTGSVSVTFINPLIDLGDTLDSVIGRSIVIHNSTDRCVQPSGNAGHPIAQGVIGLVQPFGDDEKTTINRANNIRANRTLALAATLFPTKNRPTVYGTVQTYLYAPTKKYRILVDLTGLEPFMAHSLHIHEWGLDDEDLPPSALGSHYNPEHMPHDIPNPISTARHMGDIGVVHTDAAGEIHADFALDFTSPIFHSIHRLIGRSIVLTDLPDSGAQPDGNTGVQLARGVLGLGLSLMAEMKLELMK